MTYMFFKDADEMFLSEIDVKQAINWETISGRSPSMNNVAVHHSYVYGKRKDGRYEILPLLQSAGRYYLTANLRQHSLELLTATLKLFIPGMVLDVIHDIDTTPLGFKIDRQEFTNQHWPHVNDKGPITYMFISHRSWMTDLMEVMNATGSGKHLRVTVDADFLDPGGAVMCNLDAAGFVGFRAYLAVTI